METSHRKTLGIDGSRNRSGGAKAHLIGILSEGDPRAYGFEEVHVWSYRSLLDAIPEKPWLIKHNPPALERTLLHQMWWQYSQFSKEVQKQKCDVVLNCDAGTVSTFQPAITMSRDLLSYEPGTIDRYGFSKARLRLIFLRFIQNHSLKRAKAAVFLTEHAAKIIQKSSGEISNSFVVPHGVGKEFKNISERLKWPENNQRPIECVYVSNAAMYKHQWEVVKAIEILKDSGIELKLTLVGGGSGRAQAILDEQIKISDPSETFIQQTTFLNHADLPKILERSDLAIFASSCEAFGITLLEKMAAGMPIACSERAPMPDMLKDGGVYFNPEDCNSIAVAVRRIISDQTLRETIGVRAKQIAQNYSWERSSNEIFSILSQYTAQSVT